jgi:hypothetical protein
MFKNWLIKIALLTREKLHWKAKMAAKAPKSWFTPVFPNLLDAADPL